ncbi:MAG: tetratricopeptide repeat protein [Bacteroidales bacterium]|jgi:hypothetical protein
MKTYRPVFFGITLLVFMTACRKNETVPSPDLDISVTWKFTRATSGSGWWSVPTPNKWNMDIKIRNKDNKSWTMVPDFLFLETYEEDVIAKGLNDSILAEKRKVYMPFRVDPAPGDTSDGIERTILFPAGGDMYTVLWTKASLHWKYNNRMVNWIPVNMLSNDSLDCHWEELNNYTFSTKNKFDPEYRLYLLGPVIYDSSHTGGNAYLVISSPDTCLEKGKVWQSYHSGIVTLNKEFVLEQISDTMRSPEWRNYFVAMLWDQPRPVENAGEILTSLFYNKNNPASIRFSSAYSLIGTGYVAALDSLKEFVLDENYQANSRAALLSNLYKLMHPDDCSFFKEMISDRQNPAKLRVAAAGALKHMADSLFVTGELEDDLEACLEAEDHYLQAGEYYVKKLYYKAIEEYTKALRIRTDYADALNGRGGAYMGIERIDKALAVLTRLLLPVIYGECVISGKSSMIRQYLISGKRSE